MWALGLDGSKLSWQAFDFAAGLIQRRNAGGRMCVMHVAATGEKAELVPESLKPGKLKSDVENRNIRLRLPIQFSVQDRKDGLSCGEQLQSMMEDLEDDADGTKLEANCLVIGSFGRKEKGNEVLGHVPDHTLKKLAADVFIVKQRPDSVPVIPVAPKPVTWVVGTDNSECARHALDTCLELMSPDDNLWVFYAAKYESFAKRVEAAQLEEIEKAGRKGTFVFKHVMGKANYADVLCDFAYEKQADVLVVGHGGQSAKKRPPRADGSGKLVRTQTGPRLGSVTERCASEAHCALLITKGSGRWSMGADHALQKAHSLKINPPAPAPEPEAAE